MRNCPELGKPSAKIGMEIRMPLRSSSRSNHLVPGFGYLFMDEKLVHRHGLFFTEQHLTPVISGESSCRIFCFILVIDGGV